MQTQRTISRFLTVSLLLLVAVGCGGGAEYPALHSQDKLSAADTSKSDDTTLPLGFDLPAYAKFGGRQAADIIDADTQDGTYGYQVGASVRLFNANDIFLEQVDPLAWLDYYIRISVEGTNREATFQLSPNPNGVNSLVQNLYTYQNGVTFVLELFKRLSDDQFELQDITKIVAPSADKPDEFEGSASISLGTI